MSDQFERRVTEAMEAGIAMSERDWAWQAVWLRARVEELEANLTASFEGRAELIGGEKQLRARWNYIKTDIVGARALLLLLSHGKGSPDDFDTMVDRVIESRKAAGVSDG